MSQAFAKKIIGLDIEHAKVILHEHSQDVDDDFVAFMIYTVRTYEISRNFTPAVDTLRKLFLAGKIRNDPYIQSYTSLLVAHLEKAQNHSEQAIKLAQSSQAEASKQPGNARCQQVVADAKAFLKELEDDTSAADASRELKAKNEQKKQIEAEILRLGTQKQSAIDDLENLERQRRYIQAQIAAIHLAAHAPLWVVAIQMEMQEGRLSNLTIPLLEKLRFIVPDDAEPLIYEIRARQGWASDTLIDLDSLTGDQRLFAGVLNSAALESSDFMQSVEVLTDVWETYLTNLAHASP